MSLGFFCSILSGFAQSKHDSLPGILKTPTPDFGGNVDSLFKTKNEISDSLNFSVKDKFNPGIKKDTLRFVKNKLDTFKNKATKELKIKKTDFNLHGLISTQYDYGTVPYYLPGFSTPTGLLKSEGALKFSLKKLPLQFNYFYMNPANLLGLSNYYTLKFDVETFQKNTMDEVVAQKAMYKNKLQEAEKLKLDYSKKLAYSETLKNQPYLSMPEVDGVINGLDTSFNKNNITAFNYKDSTSLNRIDTSRIAMPDTSLNYRKEQWKQKIANDTNYQTIKEYKDKIEEYDKLIKNYQQAIKLLDDPGQLSQINNPYLSKVTNFMSHIKRFEIGLCYPNYSSFLINNLTLKGINVEYASSNYFVNATYGKTVNNLLNVNTNNAIINTFQQYSNFFDFNKNQDSRKVLAGKIGLGNVTKSYIAFGALYGVGNQSYYYAGVNNKETNVVYELDGKVNYKNYIFSASYAKSFLTQASNSSIENQTLLDKSRNNALQLKLTGVVPYLKTKFTLAYKMVDPFFKSYGVGFLRTDNIRYEAKLDQTITSKIKVGLSYRRDEDNILRRFGYKSNLNFVSINTKIKLLKKRLDINLVYTPIVQKITNLTTDISVVNKSDMKNVVLSYMPKFKRFVFTVTGIYNQYSLYDTVSIKNLENYNLTLMNIFKNSFKIGTSSSYFNSNVSDSSATPRTILNSIETGYTFKKNIITTFSLKHSHNLKTSTDQYGASFNVNFPLTKYLFMDMHAEKLILGDFYNSLNYDNMNRFPYYCYAKLNLKF